MSTYIPILQNYYQRNRNEIKSKRKQKYQENIIKERQSALERHYKNKEQNNKRDLDNYYNNSDELNKKRTIRRMISLNSSCKLYYCSKCVIIFRRIIDLKSHRTNYH